MDFWRTITSGVLSWSWYISPLLFFSPTEFISSGSGRRRFELLSLTLLFLKRFDLHVQNLQFKSSANLYSGKRTYLSTGGFILPFFFKRLGWWLDNLKYKIASFDTYLLIEDKSKKLKLWNPLAKKVFLT